MFDIATVLASVLLALVASYLTYYFGIKQMVKQTLFAQKVALYKPIVETLDALSGSIDVKEMQSKLNKYNRELILYASDDVYRAYLKVMKWNKGDSFQQIVDFWMLLRKELLGKTDLKADEIAEVEISA